MIHVFMDLREADAVLPDEEGIAVPDLAAARSMAIKAARDVLREDILFGRFSLRGAIVVRAADGTILFELPFADSVALDGLVPVVRIVSDAG